MASAGDFTLNERKQMSTTLTPLPETETVIPPQVWKDYRLARLAGDKPAAARSLALENSGFTSQRGREGMVAALEAREERDGLEQSQPEREEELRLEAAAEAEAAAAALAAKRQLPQLQDDWSRLQPLVAIGDRDAIEESKDLESEMRSAKQELGRQARQAAEAAEAERERREAHDAAARKLEPAILQQKAAVDRVFAGCVPDVVKLAEMQAEREAHIVAAGGGQFDARAATFRPDQVESAVRFHLRPAGLFGRVSGRDEPLVQEVK